MANRTQRRTRHRLTSWPKDRPLPFRGVKLGGAQRAYTCVCGSGWLSIGTRESIDEAFATHREQAEAD